MKTMRLLAVAALALSGCGGVASDDTEELGHATADSMASFDETSTGGGFAALVPIDRPGWDRSMFDRALDLALPSAYGAACWTEAFATCNAGVRTRSYDACALGPYKLDGTVTLTFSEQACTLLAAGDSVTRDAEFTLTGRANATLTVSSPGGGQKATRTADGYSYTVLGMERVLKDGKGNSLIDISTQTLQDLEITGFTRKDRVINSGRLQLTHNLAGYTVVLTPNAVTWDGTCNCPVSGTLSGTVTAGKNVGASASVTFSGCGTGTATVGTDSKAVNFDRCTSL